MLTPARVGRRRVAGNTRAIESHPLSIFSDRNAHPACRSTTRRLTQLSRPEAQIVTDAHVKSDNRIGGPLAGADRVIACDNDPGALVAAKYNCGLNQVNVEFSEELVTAPDCEVLFMADVLYDRANLPLIQLAKKKCRTLIIADSRISDVEDESFSLSHQKEATTLPNLGEFEEFRTVRFFVWQA